MPEFNSIQQFVIWAIPALFAITVHEVAHGWAALKCGDPTAQMLGRLTLNPIKHIDPIGTVLLPAALFFFGGFIFGWAKPVPINPRNFKNPRPNAAWVAFAGPGANLVMMLIWALVIKFSVFLLPNSPVFAVVLGNMGYAGVAVNLILAVINLIPIPPLDGSRIVSSMLSPAAERQYRGLEPYGIWILLLLLITGALSHFISPIFTMVNSWVMSLVGLV